MPSVACYTVPRQKSVRAKRTGHELRKSRRIQLNATLSKKLQIKFWNDRNDSNSLNIVSGTLDRKSVV